MQLSARRIKNALIELEAMDFSDTSWDTASDYMVATNAELQEALIDTVGEMHESNGDIAEYEPWFDMIHTIKGFRSRYPDMTEAAAGYLIGDIETKLEFVHELTH